MMKSEHGHVARKLAEAEMEPAASSNHCPGSAPERTGFTAETLTTYTPLPTINQENGPRPRTGAECAFHYRPRARHLLFIESLQNLRHLTISSLMTQKS